MSFKTNLISIAFNQHNNFIFIHLRITKIHNSGDNVDDTSYSLVSGNIRSSHGTQSGNLSGNRYYNRSDNHTVSTDSSLPRSVRSRVNAPCAFSSYLYDSNDNIPSSWTYVPIDN